MNIHEYIAFTNENEKPLDHLVDSYSCTSIFRKIAFIGDSLSSGEFETRDAEGNPGYHDLYEYSWGQYIAWQNGLTAYNFSRGGMTAKWYLDSFADENDLWNKEKACQAYVIALGVNDLYNINMELGSIADVDVENYKNNKPTFAGYYGQIISRYREISPDAKFFFVTFPNTLRGDEYRDVTIGMVKLLQDFAEKFDNSYVINLYEYGPRYDEAFVDQYHLYGHLNATGYILTAKMIDSYIDYIIRHNPQDFKTVPFINTGIPYKV